MADIQPIGSTETGAATRSKLNLAITEANKVSAKASQTALDALQTVVGGKASQTALQATSDALTASTAQLGGRIDLQVAEVSSLYPGMHERPGDRRELFTSSLTGEGKAQVPVVAGTVVAGSDGTALRVVATGPDPLVVAARTDQATEAGQVYAARISVRRNKNTSDPLGDAIQFGISCLNAAKQKVSERIFYEGSVVVADGLISRQVTFSRDQEAELTLSETTRYVRPFVRIFGGDGITDVVVVGTWETNGLPGPEGQIGDVTPAAQAARDESIQASVSSADSAGSSETNRIASEVARDATALIAQSKGFFQAATIAAALTAGRTAVLDGQTFHAAAPDVEFIGVYRRDSSTTQTEVARFPTAAAVSAIPASSDRLLPDAEVLVDDAGSIMRRTDATGRLFVPGTDGKSIQLRLSEDRYAIHQGSGFRRRDVFQVEDDAGAITMRQAEDGAVYIPGLPSSIQSALGMSVGEPVRFPTNPRDQLHDVIKPLTQNLVVQGLPFIDPPTMLVPNRYNVPDSFVNAFQLPQPSPSRALWLETPHGPGGLVHPYLLEMRKPLNGYRYLYGDTPHLTGSSEENPCLWGSNDLRDFRLWPGIRNPLGQPPLKSSGWNADIGFTYDPRNGELICFWPGNLNQPSGNGMHYRSTWDGVNWTPEMVIPVETDLSPAILFDPIRNIWHQWNLVFPQGSIRHLTAPNYYGPYTQVSTTPAPGLWHLEVKYMGEKFVLLANTQGDQNLYFGVSSDGDAWTYGANLFTPAPPAVYKASFLPQWNGNMLRMTVAWNAYEAAMPANSDRSLYVDPTNWVDTTTLI